MSEILGLLFAVVIAAAFIPSLSSYTKRANDNTLAATTAEQHKRVIDASAQYIKQYNNDLKAIATATTPAIVTVTMLKNVKLLDSSFNSVNPFGQSWQTQVLQPTIGNLQALVLSYGGTSLDDKTASKIAGLVGQEGGLIPKNDSGIYPGGAATAYGSFGGWTQATANYTSISGGHLAGLVTVNNGQITGNYLYRNSVPGQPQLNRMNTDIDLSNNSLNNVATINTNLANATNVKSTKIETNTLDATGAIKSDSRVTANEYLQVKGTVVEGASCPSNDLIARDTTGLILSCQSGTWKNTQSSGGTGQKGMLSPFKGMGGVCTANGGDTTFTAKIDNNMNFFMSVYNRGSINAFTCNQSSCRIGAYHMYFGVFGAEYTVDSYYCNDGVCSITDTTVGCRILFPLE